MNIYSKNKNNIFLAKDAHRLKDSIACPKTSCACLLLGVNSRFTFQHFESILSHLLYFVKQVVILNIGFGFCAFDSIWEHRLNDSFEHFSNIFKKKKTQKCDRISY